jgi:hypothetical protein
MHKTMFFNANLTSNTMKDMNIKKTPPFFCDTQHACIAV